MAYTPMEAYTDAVGELVSVEAIWNPFQLIYVNSGGAIVNQWTQLVHSMQLIGVAILVLMAALKFVKVFLDELNDIPATTTILGIGVEMVLVTVFLFNYTWFAELFPLLFHKLTSAILTSYEATLMDQVLASLKAVGEEKTSEVKWFSLNALAASIPSILSTAAAGLALALYWVMSKYQALLYTFWYLIGPVLLPFYLFPPFRGVSERWFSSLLGASFMGVVGSLMFVLMAQAQWLTKAFSAGANTSYITALVFALLTLLLMISIPRISNSIWEGISASMTQAIGAAGNVSGVATAVTIGTVGAATQVAGSGIRGGAGMAGVLHRYNATRDTGMKQGRRILDAFRNGDAFAREGTQKQGTAKTLAGIHQAGTDLRDLGRGVLMSQMPSSVQRTDRALAQAGRVREGHRARKREEDEVRRHVAGALGADAAAAMSFPEKWRLIQRVGEPREESVRRAAAGYVKSRRMEDVQSRLRAEMGKLVGQEQAAAMELPANFRLKPRRGQKEEEALREAALGLLRTRRDLDPAQTRKFEHEAIAREAVRILGTERASRLVIPPEWAIVAHKGQSPRQALEGSTRALMQQQGLIDKKDENAIALRYRYALARKNRKQGKGSKGDKK
jgi:hypothetical protein